MRHLEFKKGAFFKALFLKKTHRLKTWRLILLSDFSARGALRGKVPQNSSWHHSRKPERGERNRWGWTIKHFPLDEAIQTLLKKDISCCLSNPSLFPHHLLQRFRNAVIMGKITYVDSPTRNDIVLLLGLQNCRENQPGNVVRETVPMHRKKMTAYEKSSYSE